jgi:hypothetical protein
MPWRLLQQYKKTSLPEVIHASNRPLWVADRIGEEIMSVPITTVNFSSRERLALMKSVEQLTAAVGQCERIHQVRRQNSIWCDEGCYHHPLRKNKTHT